MLKKTSDTPLLGWLARFQVYFRFNTASLERKHPPLRWGIALCSCETLFRFRLWTSRSPTKGGALVRFFCFFPNTFHRVLSWKSHITIDRNEWSRLRINNRRAHCVQACLAQPAILSHVKRDSQQSLLVTTRDERCSLARGIESMLRWVFAELICFS